MIYEEQKQTLLLKTIGHGGCCGRKTKPTHFAIEVIYNGIYFITPLTHVYSKPIDVARELREKNIRIWTNSVAKTDLINDNDFIDTLKGLNILKQGRRIV